MRDSREGSGLGGRAAIVPALALVVSASLGCQEAVNLDDLIDSNPGASKVSADFQPETVPPGVTDHYVALTRNSASGNRIMLDVVVTGVSEAVSGIAIKLSYDPSVARFTGCSDGNLFQPGTCYWSEQPAGSGEVFIGRSITAPEQPISVAGSGTIVRLSFEITQTGQSTIVFEAQNLGGGDATALLDANGDPILVSWFEGALIGD